MLQEHAEIATPVVTVPDREPVETTHAKDDDQGDEDRLARSPYTLQLRQLNVASLEPNSGRATALMKGRI